MANDKMSIFAGILAGGSGTRMGGNKPKQLIMLGGKPVLVHTIERFLSVKRIEEIIVAVPADRLDEIGAIVSGAFGGEERIAIIPGGTDRNGSLVNIINAIRQQYSGEDALLISHDAARPFVTRTIIEAGIDAALRTGASNTAIPAVDTPLRSLDGVTVSSIPDRNGLYNTQTPQTFHIDAFMCAYMRLGDAERKRATDACSVLLSAGAPIELVMGEASNIKLTTPFDLLVAKAILEERGRAAR